MYENKTVLTFGLEFSGLKTLFYLSMRDKSEGTNMSTRRFIYIVEVLT